MANAPPRWTVVDASVAVKLVIQEDHSDRARLLLASFRGSDQPPFVPPHFHGEVANAIYQQTRRKNLLVTEGRVALDRFSAWTFRTSTYKNLPRAAFDLASEHQVPSLYDATYLALAEQLDADFWTDDRRLLALLGDKFPNARWIGDFELT